ncbi:predicted protein [Histoplasma capsulatum H143]|uniref:Uncharacterized protein n=1 Tax=Ajellomyces capsulatus (strain H143) TaxID=544712 RepID=C6HQG7_AJECH|nr:predicted protein [Histoplasma capsulatum H143]
MKQRKKKEEEEEKEKEKTRSLEEKYEKREGEGKKEKWRREEGKRKKGRKKERKEEKQRRGGWRQILKIMRGTESEREENGKQAIRNGKGKGNNRPRCCWTESLGGHSERQRRQQKARQGGKVN